MHIAILVCIWYNYDAKWNPYYHLQSVADFGDCRGNVQIISQKLTKNQFSQEMCQLMRKISALCILQFWFAYDIMLPLDESWSLSSTERPPKEVLVLSGVLSFRADQTQADYLLFVVAVQPFADTICNYTSHNSDKKWVEVQHSTPPLCYRFRRLPR